jgi:hypothetical protein
LHKTNILPSPREAHPYSILQHQVLARLTTEQDGREGAADLLELIGNMLAAGIDVGQHAAEGLIGVDTGPAGRPEQAGREVAAALRHQGRMELVFQPQPERRQLAALGICAKMPEVAQQDGLHLIDGGRGFGASELRHRIVGRPAAAAHARAAVAQEGIEHALQGAERRGRDAAHENLAERQAIE